VTVSRTPGSHDFGVHYTHTNKRAVRVCERLAIEEGILYERDLFCLCFSSEDKKEGVEAFLQKRPAAWKGR